MLGSIMEQSWSSGHTCARRIGRWKHIQSTMPSLYSHTTADVQSKTEFLGTTMVGILNDCQCIPCILDIPVESANERCAMMVPWQRAATLNRMRRKMRFFPPFGASRG